MPAVSQNPKSPPADGRAGTIRQGSAAGFSLLEILIAMTLLAMIVLMVGQLFQNASVVWEVGTRRVDLDLTARTAVDMIARELSAAVAGKIDAVAPNPAVPELTFAVAGADELNFLSATETPDGSSRALRGNCFRRDPNSNLEYKRITTTLDCYNNATWYNDSGSGYQSLVSNVVTLQFYVFRDANDLVSGTAVGAPAVLTELPACVDIYLEVLSDEDAARARTLSGGAYADYVARKARRYATRVYCANRIGYLAR